MNDRARRPRSARSESGETLIELLAAIVLLGVGGAVLLTALLTISANAAVNKERTKVSSFLARWGDSVAAPKYPSGSHADIYQVCADPLTANPAFPVPAGITVTRKVEFLAGGQPSEATDFNNLTWTTSESVCRANGGDRGLQKITLYASTEGKHAVKDSLVVYIRRTTCPANFNNADLGPC